MRLEIKAGSSISLLERSFRFSEHPAAPGIAFISDASRARVVRVTREDDSEPFALKIFKPKFRDSRQVEIANGLQTFAHVPGLRVAQRNVLQAEDPIVSSYPELQYAVLMPWVGGRTWFDLLVDRLKGGHHVTPAQSLGRVTAFLSLMEKLEECGFAHCDISAGNVMITENGRIELIDLEDAYFPGAMRPMRINIGTPGYHHPATAVLGGVWDDMADRHAAAMLVAEMILVSNPSLSAGTLGDQGLFADAGVSGSDGAQRWREFLDFSEGIAPRTREAVMRALRATRLSECPSLAELAAGARLDQSRVALQDYAFTSFHQPTPLPRASVVRVMHPPRARTSSSLTFGLALGAAAFTGIMTLLPWCN